MASCQAQSIKAFRTRRIMLPDAHPSSSSKIVRHRVEGRTDIASDVNKSAVISFQAMKRASLLVASPASSEPLGEQQRITTVRQTCNGHQITMRLFGYESLIETSFPSQSLVSFLLLSFFFVVFFALITCSKMSRSNNVVGMATCLCSRGSFSRSNCAAMHSCTANPDLAPSFTSARTEL